MFISAFGRVLLACNHPASRGMGGVAESTVLYQRLRNVPFWVAEAGSVSAMFGSRSCGGILDAIDVMKDADFALSARLAGILMTSSLAQRALCWVAGLVGYYCHPSLTRSSHSGSRTGRNSVRLLLWAIRYSPLALLLIMCSEGHVITRICCRRGGCKLGCHLHHRCLRP
jgi:hypothetical protein